jgi:hypothetical protein
MFFYLFHHLNHSDGKNMNDPDYHHGARNVRTFLMGSIAYIFLAAFLYSSQYQGFVSSLFFLSALRDWLLWFIAVDAIAMAIVFKQYWGFSILREGKEALDMVDDEKV